MQIVPPQGTFPQLYLQFIHPTFTEATTVATVFLPKKSLVTSQRTEPTPTITFPLLGVFSFYCIFGFLTRS